MSDIICQIMTVLSYNSLEMCAGNGPICEEHKKLIATHLSPKKARIVQIAAEVGYSISLDCKKGTFTIGTEVPISGEIRLITSEAQPQDRLFDVEEIPTTDVQVPVLTGWNEDRDEPLITVVQTKVYTYKVQDLLQS